MLPILPFLMAAGKMLGSAALTGAKAVGGAALSAGKTMLPNILSAAASNLLGGGQLGETQDQGGTIGGSQVIQGQNPFQTPQNLFQYDKSNISQALMNLLKQSRGLLPPSEELKRKVPGALW